MLYACPVEWRAHIHLTLTILQRMAASYGAKVALIESTDRLGGTCVNVGKSLS